MGSVDKRVAVEQFLNVPLAAERTFSFRSGPPPRGRRRIRRALAVAAILAVAGVGPLLFVDGPWPVRSGAAERAVALSVEVAPEPSR